MKLDFTLDLTADRISYLQTLDLSKLRPSELETAADYILWGKDPDGTPSFSHKELNWAYGSDSKSESLDALYENPSFSENFFRKRSSPHKNPKLDREEIRSSAPPYILSAFEDLWRRIDTVDLRISLYEIQIGKREEIRPELRQRVASAAIPVEKNASLVSDWDQRAYLLARRQLIELRREQYTLKDEIKTPILTHNVEEDFYEDRPTEIQTILPCGAYIPDSPFWDLEINLDLNSSSLKDLTSLLWTQPQDLKTSFNFADPSQLYELISFLPDLSEEIERSAAPSSPSDFTASNASTLLQTFDFYRSYANLSPTHSLLLDLKIKRFSNAEIAKRLNSEFNTNYNVNYISTIYTKKILPEIADAAKRHREILENLFFPENFKRCTRCGRLYLRSSTYFMKKGNSSDGFSPRCKQCWKEIRQEKKQKNTGEGK